MKKFPLLKILLNIWQTVEVMLRVWDYNKFRRSLLFTFRLLKNKSAELKIPMKGSKQPLIFTLQITGDILVFIPDGPGNLNTEGSASDLPRTIKRQLKALMYAPNILLAMFIELSGLVVLILQYGEKIEEILTRLF